jgi:hypothetical protein
MLLTTMKSISDRSFIAFLSSGDGFLVSGLARLNQDTLATFFVSGRIYYHFWELDSKPPSGSREN